VIRGSDGAYVNTSPRRVVLSVLALVLLVGGGLAGVTNTASAADTSAVLNGYEADLVARTNAARADASLPALVAKPGLTDLARSWASSMAAAGAPSHNPNLSADLISSGASQWTTAAENVGQGGASSAVFTAYMSSAPHKANILRAGVTTIGVGSTRTSDGKIWDVMVFSDAYDDAFGPGRSTLQPMDASGEPTAASPVVSGGSSGAPTAATPVVSAAGSGAPTAATPVVSGAASAYTPVNPQRLFDTRSSRSTPLSSGEQLDVAVLGHAGVPSTGVTAVVLNLTSAGSTSPTFVTAWPAGQARPATSSLNVDIAGEEVANQVTVPVGAGGLVSFVSSAPTHLLADVSGYYSAAPTASAGRFIPTTPARLFDTRSTSALRAGGTISVGVTGRAGVPSSGVSSVLLNLTATGGSSSGWVTAWPTGSARQDTSSLNIARPGQTVANLVSVPVGADGTVSFYSSGGTQLLGDVQGYVTDTSAASSTTGLFVPVTPTRAVDTRTSPSLTPSAGRTVVLPDLAPAGASAVLLNFTATQAAAPGWVTVWPGSAAQAPVSSVLNLERAGQTRANAVAVAADGSGASVMSPSGIQAVVDVAGYFLR
jgi:hypothetical protein